MPVLTPPLNITGGVSNFANLLRIVKPFDEDAPEGRSYLGTPIYGRLTFDAIQGDDLSDLSADIQRIVSTDLVIDIAIITVSQTKNIIKTAVQGRGGTVKEFISNGDYLLKINGIISGEAPLVYPKEEVKRFKTFCELNQTINISSNFLNIFNIGAIVIDFFDVDEMEGVRNMSTFRINAVSDDPFILDLSENLNVNT